MPRKRRIGEKKDSKREAQLQANREAMKKHLYNAQINEVYHKKYAKELRELYVKMEHEEFTSTFILCLKQLMQGDHNEFKNRGLKFMAEFVSTFQAEDMHPLFDAIFLWIFKTISLTVNVRLRLCEFVNGMLNALPAGGDIEEFHVAEILSYMFERLKDTSPHVRVQAIKALCRLQMKDDPEDEVTQIFLFHLEHDPSPMVRKAVISSMARSMHTIPFIMARLSDVDERVRCSILAHMSNFSFNRYTIEQRLTLLEHGLNNSSANVRNITSNIMLPEWLAFCKNDFLTLLSNLKLTGDESVTSRFRSVARMSLLAIFRLHDPKKLIEILPLIETDDDRVNFRKCLHLEKLTLELSVFWATLIEFFQGDTSKNEYLEQIVPDITTYCSYLVTLSVRIKLSDDVIGLQSIFLTLIELLQKLDLIDDIGRQSVKNLVTYLLVQTSCDESLIKGFIKICEKSIPESGTRLQFYVDTVKRIIHPIGEEADFITEQINADAEMQVQSLKRKLLELKEKVTMDISECEVAAIHEEMAVMKERIMFLIIPYLPSETITTNLQSVTAKSLQPALMFFSLGICSENVKQLISSAYQLYQDVIRHQVNSKNVIVKNWALKCTATFGLFNKQHAKDAYCTFCKEILRHEVKCVWLTSIAAIFQLICRYGLNLNKESNTTPSHTSNSIETPLSSEPLKDIYDIPSNENDCVSGGDILRLFKDLLTSCDDADITCELVDGFCFLMLHRPFFDKQILSKLVIMFFSNNVPPKVTQILGIFFETLIRLKKQIYFQICLYETMTNATSDQTLDESALRLVLKFFIHSTAEEEQAIESGAEKQNLHDNLAATLLAWMIEHPSKHKILNFTSKEMLQLKVSDNEERRLHLMELVNRLLEKPLNKETEQNVKLFQAKIQTNGQEALQFSSTQPADGVDEEDIISANVDSCEFESVIDEEIVSENQNTEGNKNKSRGETPDELVSRTGKENENLPKRKRGGEPLVEENSKKRIPFFRRQ